MKENLSPDSVGEQVLKKENNIVRKGKFTRQDRARQEYNTNQMDALHSSNAAKISLT